MTHPDLPPLNRLLKRPEASALLQAFEALVPQGNLALVRTDGRLFAGADEWPQVELAQLLAQVSDGQPLRTTEILLYPLLVKSRLVGALVASSSTREQVLRSIHRSLTMYLEQALEKRDVARETLERYREINLLYHVGETIGACLNPIEIPDLVLTAANRVIEAGVGAVLLPVAEDDDRLEIKATFGAACDVEALPDAAQQLIDQVQRAGQSDIMPDMSIAPGSTWAVLGAPVKAGDRVLGVILLGRQAGQLAFTASDEKLVMALANQAAIALERAWLHQQEIKRQRLEEELAVGRQIQLSLLPQSCPTIPGWEFAAFYQAARQVGGDLYDFFKMPEEPHRLGMIIADVTGKGVPAAMFMALSRTIIRAQSMTGCNPAAVLEQANRVIVQDHRSGLFLSAFYATLVSAPAA
jgi:hypothetical protein